MDVSSSFLLRPNWTRPQGSSVVGMRFMKFSAMGEKREGEILFPANGASRLICRPLLHAGEATDVQSPASIAVEGIKAIASVGAERCVVRCRPPKKNSLFFAMGPPIVPPNWFRLRESRVRAYALRALNE